MEEDYNSQSPSSLTETEISMQHCVNQLSWHGLKGEGFNRSACAHGRLRTGHKLNPLLEKQLTCSSDEGLVAC